MKTKLTLFLTFLKIGAFTFGGGYAMLALLDREFVDRKHWLTKDEFLDMTAIAESTPGPMAVNSATFIGYRIAGIQGAAISTFAVCLPSFVIIYVISLFFDRFLSLRIVSLAFREIQICVVYLILTAGFKMLRSLQKSVFNMMIVLLVLTAMIFFSVSSISFSSVFYILICGMAGLFVFLLKKHETDRN